MTIPGDLLRNAMRRWTTGVSVVTSVHNGIFHGMTVNSFTSISLQPPRVCVTLADHTRTCRLVMSSSVFGVTILSEQQLEVAERFAGRGHDSENRFAGLDTFTLESGSLFILGGLAFVDCQVVHQYPMTESILFIGEVIAAQQVDGGCPLVYTDRKYHGLR